MSHNADIEADLLGFALGARVPVGQGTGWIVGGWRGDLQVLVPDGRIVVDAVTDLERRDRR